MLEFFPVQCNIQGMCEKVVLEDPGTLQFVPDMCERAVEGWLYSLIFVPNKYKIKHMCKVVDEVS